MAPKFPKNRVTHDNWVSSWKPERSVTYGKQKKVRQKPGSKRNRYSVEFKLRAVQLYTKEGYSAEMVAEELGVGKSSLSAWARRYREKGVAGLEPRVTVCEPRIQIDPAVKARTVDLKKPIRRAVCGATPA